MKYTTLSREEFIEEIKKGNFINFDSSDVNLIKSDMTKYRGYFAKVSNDNPLFMRSLLGKRERRRFGLQDTFSNEKEIQELIYCKIGITSHKDFYIGKLDDDWFLIELSFRVRGKEGTKSEYYKCDQIDGILDLLKSKTKTHRVFNKEEFERKADYKNRVNKVIRRIKSMDFKEFDKLYKNLIKDDSRTES